ncbi:hypothetical protein V1279_006495 [Bradyrhizobium sp. AZCC 1610]
MRLALTILFTAMFIAIAVAGILLAPAPSDAAPVVAETLPVSR